MMSWLLIFVIVFASGGKAQLEDVENCDTKQLDVCVAKVPYTPVGLPRTKEELDAHCLAYNTGMSCMEEWMKRCLPTDGQKFLQRQIRGARTVMRYLCTNETALRKAFLKEPQCWHRVSAEWSQCVSELTVAVREIDDQAQQLTYFNRNAELCCARDAFLMCVEEVAQVCSQTASNLLKRLAFVLAQDVATCTHQPKAYCSASPPPAAAPILIALYNALFHFPRF